MKFYVYRHIRLDTNTPFYIGKGSDNRAYRLDTRNTYHKRVSTKHGCKVEILKYFNNEQDAFKFEKSLIKLYKSLGYCETNMTMGGEGTSGLTPWNKGIKIPKWICIKMSKNRTGFRKPTPHTLETKIKISNSKLGIKQSKENIIKRMKNKYSPFIVYTKDGIYIGRWEFARQCARDLNLQTSNICRCLSGDRLSHKGFIFKKEIL